MIVPGNAFEVGTVVVLLLPGLIYAVVRRRLRGYQHDDLSLDARIAQALVVSVILGAMYATLAWRWFNSLVSIDGSEVRVLNPPLIGASILTAFVAVPAVLAFILNAPLKVTWRRKGGNGPLFKIHRTIRSSEVPTAWDHAATRPDHRMIRVKRADGSWVGGFFGPDSFVSTYPQPRDMYLSTQYNMSAEGEFLGPAPESEGIWLRIRDEDVVEFVTAVYKDSDQEAAPLDSAR